MHTPTHIHAHTRRCARTQHASAGTHMCAGARIRVTRPHAHLKRRLRGWGWGWGGRISSRAHASGSPCRRIRLGDPDAGEPSLDSEKTADTLNGSRGWMPAPAARPILARALMKRRLRGRRGGGWGRISRRCLRPAVPGCLESTRLPAGMSARASTLRLSRSLLCSRQARGTGAWVWNSDAGVDVRAGVRAGPSPWLRARSGAPRSGTAPCPPPGARICESGW